MLTLEFLSHSVVCIHSENHFCYTTTSFGDRCKLNHLNVRVIKFRESSDYVILDAVITQKTGRKMPSLEELTSDTEGYFPQGASSSLPS